MHTPFLSTMTLLGFLLPSLFATAAQPPNVLVIMADDCTYNDLPMYGGQNARTPNLSELARESLVFDNAFLCSAMCQPCRAELYSGQYPLRNGCAWNHSASRPSVLSMPHYFGDLGYRVGIAGKVHVTPRTVFPFEYVEGFDKSCVRNPTKAHSLAGLEDFLSRNPQQPFCMVVALVEPHVPWVMGDASAYPPKDIQLPPNLADTELTRQDYGKYLAEITYMDNQVGQLLESLEKSGQAENTIVVFTSEQGSQFPGCKWTNWNTGVHTALMVRWPERIEAGRTRALVQYADVLPTLLDAVGGKQPEQEGVFDGSSFLSVLQGNSDQHREFTFHMHNNVPEGPSYPIRAVSDGRYHYIRNLTPEALYIEKHLMGIKDEGRLNNRYWQTWVWNSEASDRTYQLVSRYMQRPGEELYDLQADPYEMDNLIGQSEDLLAVRQRLAGALEKWMAAQGDPGIAQDSKQSHQAAKRGEHRFVPPESP